MTNELTFDPASHTYTKDGRVLPSVTQILQAAGIIDTSWFTEQAAWRGSVVHKCCYLDDEGILDEASVAEEAKGYLDAWRLFKAQVPMNFVASEQPLCSGLYAGTPDRDAEWAVVDIKTGAILPWVGLQLAAYSELIRQAAPLATRPVHAFDRYAVRLGKDGRYNVQHFAVRDYRNDLGIFRAALSIYYWRNS